MVLFAFDILICGVSSTASRMRIFKRSPKVSDFSESVALFRDLIIFFAIISYFVGWVYLNEYLSHFGLYLANLEIPFYYYFIFSYPPMIEALAYPTWADGFRVTVILASFAACVAAYRIRLTIGYFAVALCFFTILFISFQIAIDKSQLHARHILNGGGKVIGFVFDVDVADNYRKWIENDLIHASTTGRLRLVWRTEGDVYAVDVGAPSSMKPTYRIPTSTFVFSRVIGNTSVAE